MKFLNHFRKTAPLTKARRGHAAQPTLGRTAGATHWAPWPVTFSNRRAKVARLTPVDPDGRAAFRRVNRARRRAELAAIKRR